MVGDLGPDEPLESKISQIQNIRHKTFHFGHLPLTWFLDFLYMIPGSERDVLVGPKVMMEAKRKCPSTQLPAEEEEQLPYTQEANFADGRDEASSASLRGNPENDTKDTADVKQMFPSIHPLRRSRAPQDVMSRASEAREDGPPSART